MSPRTTAQDDDQVSFVGPGTLVHSAECGSDEALDHGADLFCFFVNAEVSAGSVACLVVLNLRSVRTRAARYCSVRRAGEKFRSENRV